MDDGAKFRITRGYGIFSEIARERVGDRPRAWRPRIRPVRPAKRLVRFVDRGRRPVHDIRAHRRSFCRNFDGIISTKYFIRQLTAPRKQLVNDFVFVIENGRQAQASFGLVRIGHRDTQISRGAPENRNAKRIGGRDVRHAKRRASFEVQQIFHKSERD